MNDDLQRLFDNLDPDAAECVEAVILRLASHKLAKYTGRVVLTVDFGQGSLFDASWSDQLAGKRKRQVRSGGI